MRHHISHLTIAAAVAALSVACGGRTSSVNMSEERAQSSLNGNTNPRMELIGCVKPSVTKAEGSYIIEHVTMPPGEFQPEAFGGANALIPRGSWVRLGGPDMHQHLGKQVLVSGNLVDTAATGGAGSAPKPGDYVEWNKTPANVPLFAVETVKDQGDCKGE